MRRGKNRREMPSDHPVVKAQRAIYEATLERDRAFLAAAEEGWSIREIGNVVGMGGSTVLIIIKRAENS